MNICIATSNYFPDTGGISTYSQRLSGLLKKFGHTVVVLTVDITAKDEDDDLIENDQRGVTLVKLKKTFFNYYNYYKKYFKPGGIDAPYWLSIGNAMQEWLIDNNDQFKIDIVQSIGMLEHEEIRC